MIDRTVDDLYRKMNSWMGKGSRSDRITLAKFLAKDSKRRLPKRGGARLFRFPKRNPRWIIDIGDEKAPSLCSNITTNVDSFESTKISISVLSEVMDNKKPPENEI